jgi:hypothetical protein
VPLTVRDAVGEDMATGRGGGGGRVAAAPVPKSSGSGSGGGGMFGSLCGGMSGAARDEGQAGSSDDDSTDSDSDFDSDSDSSETDADRDLVRTAGRPAVPLGRQITVCNRRWHWELPAKGAVSRGSQGARECMRARARWLVPHTSTCTCTTQLYPPRPFTCAVSRHRRCVVTASQVSLATMHHLQT